MPRAGLTLHEFYHHQLTYTKGPETKDDNDEVNHICQEYQGINISGCAVFVVQDVLEEAAHWLEHTLCPGRRGRRWWSGGAAMPFAPHHINRDVTSH